jgi:putative oxidoreductase
MVIPCLMNGFLNLAGRLSIALLFVGGGLQKVIDPAPVQQMTGMLGLPCWLILPVVRFNFLVAARIGSAARPSGQHTVSIEF